MDGVRRYSVSASGVRRIPEGVMFFMTRKEEMRTREAAFKIGLMFNPAWS